MTELKTLAKSLQINCSSLKKRDIADAIVKHSQRRNVSNFFTCASDATEKMVLKRFVCAAVVLVFNSIVDVAIFALFVGHRTCDLQVAGSSSGWALLRSGLGQATYICVPLPPSIIIWYRSMRDDLFSWESDQ